MKRRIVSLILAVAMTAGLTACGSSASSTSTTAAGSEAAGTAEDAGSGEESSKNGGGYRRDCL